MTRALVLPTKKMRRAKSAVASGKQRDSDASRPQPEERPILDERVPGLLFDSLAIVQAAMMSASKGVPYRALRQVMTIGEQEKGELTRSAQEVAAKHAAFFSEYKDALEFVAALTAINAAHIDHLHTLIDHSDRSPLLTEFGAAGDHVCSAREALGTALIVLAPLGLLALVLLIQH